MEASGDVCIPNIGAQGRRMRQRFGLTAIGIGAALAAVLIVLGVSPLWRLAVFVPILMGATGIFQARGKT